MGALLALENGRRLRNVRREAGGEGAELQY